MKWENSDGSVRLSRVSFTAANSLLCMIATMSIMLLTVHGNQSMTINTGYEETLLKRLLRNYNKKLSPPGPIQVKFGLNLKKIVNLIEKDQIIVVDAWIDHVWIDKRLSWGKNCVPIRQHLIFKVNSFKLRCL